ncbi:MAG: glycoside hydrolase family 127 protein [Candidatus Sumerlaeota bacterium]|nr:glycoside hydrolase family 127 protein [Candidatus Sumerlaeota bacterium]
MRRGRTDKGWGVLAKRFRDEYVYAPMLEGRDVLHSLLHPRRKRPGLHANTQIPKFTGYQRIYELTGERDFNTAALNFWRIVVEHYSYGIGGNSAREHFVAPDKWEESIRHPAGPESCNTYNMLKLTAGLFRCDPQPEFVEFYERAMFNHALSTVNPRTGGRIYFTALCPMAYRTSDPGSTLCCGFTVMEMHFLAHEMIYAHTSDQLWVSRLDPVHGEPMHFRTRNLVRPADVTLKPFFEMADERYSAYLPAMNEASWGMEQTRRDKLAATQLTVFMASHTMR